MSDLHYVDGELIYSKGKRYYHLFMRDLEYTRNGVLPALTPEEKREMKKLAEFLILEYRKIAQNACRHRSFFSYPNADKEDLVSFAVERALNIGIEGNSNYGLPYFIRFKWGEKTNLFAFWWQMVKVFFYQYLNDYYRNSNTKQEVLQQMMHDFEHETREIHGCYGVKFQLADGQDEQ